MRTGMLPENRQEMACGGEGRPLCVDLDGTLIKSDLLIEGLLALIKVNPLYLFTALFWLVRGKACLKEQIARRTDLDVVHLPYHADFLEFLRKEVAAGRRLILATGANEKLARQVADHLGLFHSILASDGGCNLTGVGKLRAIQKVCGSGGFDYAGNAAADLPLCRGARQVILVNAGRRLARGVRQAANLQREFEDRRGGILPYLRAMRMHQWLKNLLLFLSLLTTHQWHQPAQLAAAALGFFAFCLSASAIYLLNDMLDLPADRLHPHKCRRPLAAGEVPLLHGGLLMAVLLAAGLLVAGSLPDPFLWVLLVYLGVTVAYSIYLKKVVIIDVVVLAGLYTVRVIAGAAAIDVAPSFWLLSFSMFIFFSLALVKRYAELRALASTRRTAAGGRDYRRSDLGILYSMGTASGFLSILVFALFINSPELARDYAHPEALWLICPVLLYWIGRIWVKAGRGEMNEDPLVFTVRDTGSRLVLLICIVIALLAQ